MAPPWARLSLTSMASWSWLAPWSPGSSMFINSALIAIPPTFSNLRHLRLLAMVHSPIRACLRKGSAADFQHPTCCLCVIMYLFLELKPSEEIVIPCWCQMNSLCLRQRRPKAAHTWSGNLRDAQTESVHVSPNLWRWKIPHPAVGKLILG